MSQPEMMRGPTGGKVSETSRQQATSDFLRPQAPLANVVGFGHGVKWTGGRPTGEHRLGDLLRHEDEYGLLARGPS
ncbi:hypothetical protein KDA82_38310, partial [Streptomyces daliensis]|nr:hypothetical protein [Streptomyces daliensis]